MVLSKNVLSEIKFGPGECFGTYDIKNPDCTKTCVIRLPCRRLYITRKKEEEAATASDEQCTYTEAFFARLETELVLQDDRISERVSIYSYQYGDGEIVARVEWRTSHRK